VGDPERSRRSRPGGAVGATAIAGVLALLGATVSDGGDRGPFPAAPAEIVPGETAAARRTLLPGIGPVLARRIAEVERRRGGFDSLEDLEVVPGIGPRTVEEIRILLHPSEPVERPR